LRYLLELSYNGTNYHGWQIQPNSITVQAVIEKALSVMLNQKIHVVGAGRTDAGVHAAYFCLHFDSSNSIDDQKGFIYKLNSYLKSDIYVINILKVSDDFHARFDALARTYQYKLTIKKNPFLKDQAYYIRKNLDFSKMNLAALKLFNYTNFKCFSKSNTDVKTYNCTIKKAVWVYRDNCWFFEISANRFLRNMVRAIVGTLIEIGEGKKEVEYFDYVIRNQKRELAGYSVPAHGLYLVDILYPENFLSDE
jgi:tRNA pseudouridine38-40 synthase